MSLYGAARGFLGGRWCCSMISRQCSILAIRGVCIGERAMDWGFACSSAIFEENIL